MIINNILANINLKLAGSFPGLFRYGRDFLPRTGRFTCRQGNYLISNTTNRPVPNLLDCKNVLFIPGPGIGDSLVITPTFQLLKTLFPHLAISVINYGFYSPLLDAIPGLDSSLALDTSASCRPDCNELTILTDKLLEIDRDSPYDIYIKTCAPVSSDLWTRTAKLLKGYIVSGSSLPCANTAGTNSLIATLFNKFPFNQSPPIGIQWGLTLLAPFMRDCQYFPTEDLDSYLMPNLSPHLFEDSSLRLLHNKLSPLIDFTKPVIFLNFLSYVFRRTLPLDIAAYLVNHLSQSFPDASIVINHGCISKPIRHHPDNMTEGEYLDRLGGSIDSLKNVVLAPELSLTELAQLLFFTKYIFTVDSGISHISSSKQLAHIPSTVLVHSIQNRQEWGINRNNRNYYIAREHTLVNQNLDPYHLNDDIFINFVLKSIRAYI